MHGFLEPRFRKINPLVIRKQNNHRLRIIFQVFFYYNAFLPIGEIYAAPAGEDMDALGQGGDKGSRIVIRVLPKEPDRPDLRGRLPV